MSTFTNSFTGAYSYGGFSTPLGFEPLGARDSFTGGYVTNSYNTQSNSLPLGTNDNPWWYSGFSTQPSTQNNALLNEFNQSIAFEPIDQLYESIVNPQPVLNPINPTLLGIRVTNYNKNSMSFTNQIVSGNIPTFLNAYNMGYSAQGDIVNDVRQYESAMQTLQGSYPFTQDPIISIYGNPNG